MMSTLNRIVAQLRRDEGTSIPEAIIATLVSATVMGAIAAGIIAVTSLFNQVATSSASVNETSVTDMRWRTDLHTAVGITPTSSTQVKFTIPIAGGACQEELWAYTPASGLTVANTSYPTLTGNACTGTSVATTSETLMGATANATFTYTNPAGRAITYTAGSGTLATGTKPAGVDQAAWDSGSATAASLNATSTYPGHSRSIHSTQQASTILASGAGTATVTPKSVAAGQTLLGNPLINTIAGTGTAGTTGDGAAATAATLKTPNDSVADASGNVYVLDTGNNRIRKIDATTKVISAYAGSGTAGSTDSTTLTTATFNQPKGIAIGSDGSIYVADTGSNKIRKITASGVTTLAGTGTASSVDNATGLSATFYAPTGIAVTSAGTVYVADASGNKIRSISPTAPNAVVTVAGSGTASSVNGTGTAATFNSPQGIALDSAGANLFIADSTGNQIRQMVISSAVVTTLAGSATAGTADGTGATAQFKTPKDVAVASDGTVYVADTGNNLIRAITSAGVSRTIAGSATASSVDGTKATATFNAPAGIRVQADGSLLVADTTGNKIRSVK